MRSHANRPSRPDSGPMELQESLVLSPVFGTVPSTGQHQHEGITFLQLRQCAAFPAVVRKLVVGEGAARDDVGSHRRICSMPRHFHVPSRRAQKRGCSWPS